MSNSKLAYKGIFRAMSIFGGVQVFNILISIIRSKLVAVLLGPTGIGLVGLFTSSISFISGLFSFGLGISAVKDISAAESSSNNMRISIVVATLRRWIWITGIFATIITSIISPFLSQWTFGSKDYTIGFLCLSITLLFSQLTSGQFVVLQGMRKLSYLAKANVLGNFLSLLITIPLYYFFRVDAIVPVIIISSIVSLYFSHHFTSKLSIKPIKISRRRIIAEGKSMLAVGLVISSSNLMVLGVTYLIRIYVGREGGLIDVGLFSAGFSIISTYTGMVFSAMLTDYLPRISAVANDNNLCKQVINQQAELTILIISPILLFFLIFINWFIILFYSNQFISVTNMMYWGTIGIFFKVISWSIGFILIAKGESKVFFISELIGNCYSLLFSLIGYYIWGVTGLGIANMLSLFVLSVQIFYISKIKYDFNFIPEFYKIFSVQIILALSSLIVVKYLYNPYQYLAGSFFILLSMWYSYHELDKRIKIKEDILNYFHNIRNLKL